MAENAEQRRARFQAMGRLGAAARMAKPDWADHQRRAVQAQITQDPEAHLARCTKGGRNCMAQHGDKVQKRAKAKRLAKPSACEQVVLDYLHELGLRYRTDYNREVEPFKGQGVRYSVDIVFRGKRGIDVHGPVHRLWPRAWERDKLARLLAAGWVVLNLDVPMAGRQAVLTDDAKERIRDLIAELPPKGAPHRRRENPKPGPLTRRKEAADDA